MNTPNSSDMKPAVYLEQIDIENNTRTRLRVVVQKDNNVVEIQQKGRESSWIPSHTLELEYASKITIHARRKHNPFGRVEVLAVVNREDVMKAFWEFKDSISFPGIFDRQPATVTIHFRPSQILETTRGAVETLQTPMKEYKSLTAESTAEFTDSVVGIGMLIAEACISFFLLPTSDAAKMNPLAKLAFSLAKCTFDLLTEQRKYDDKVSDLASGIEALRPFAMRTVQSILYEEELLDGVVRRMYVLIGETASFVIGYAQRGPSINDASLARKDNAKFKALQQDFGQLKDEFDRAVDVTALTEAKKTEEADLLKRLRPVDAANYDENHGCMEGTRTEILDEMVAWATAPLDGMTQLPDHNSIAKVFWLYGMPGLGKTSVANSLCGRLHRSGNLGGSFGCKHDLPDLREPKRVLSTLIAQLMRAWGPFRRLVAQVLLHGPQIDPGSTSGELLLKPLRLLKKHPPHPLVLVIDGLDEGGDPTSRGPLLTSLVEACSLVHWLRIVVISRQEPDIQSFFDGRPITSQDLATVDVKGKDIRIFAERRLASIASRHHLPQDWPGSERVNQIVERSHGLFIYMDTLSRLVDVPEPGALLVEVLGGKLEGADAELHKLYCTAVTSRAIRKTEDIRLVLRAVSAVSACRPLCPETLAKLTGLEVPAILSLVHDLGSLLYQDGAYKDGVRVRHLSVLEFLVGPACPAEFRVDQKLANLELTRYCLVTMANELQFNICGLETAYVSNADVHDLNDRVERRIQDTLQYSCVYWANHLCYDDSPVSTTITALLDGFFAESQPLYWIEVLSLMGQMSVVVSALRQMKACFKKFEDRHQLLVEDTLRFVLSFFTPISTSTPHLYISAFPFMLAESDVCKRARILFPGIMEVHKGHTKSWPAPSNIWKGHTRAILSVAYSPDGRNVVSGSKDSTIRIWDARTGAAVGEPLKGHAGWVFSVAYSPDGRNVISASSDNTIRIWNAQTGSAVGKPLKGHTKSVKSVTYSPDGQSIISGSDDKTIRIWDTQTGAAVEGSFKGHTGSIESVAYSPDGRHVVSGSSDNTIRIWDTQTGDSVGKPVKGHTGSVSSVAYSPDGQRLISGSYDNTIRIWHARSRLALGDPLKQHTKSVKSIVCSSDGRSAVSGSGDHTVRLWDVLKRAAVGQPLIGHTGPVLCVAYSPDGQSVVSGSEDSTIRIWDAQNGRKKDTHGISGSINHSINQLSLSTFPGSAIPTMHLGSDGWVHNAEGLLFWVPEDCRDRLVCPPVTANSKTSHQRCVGIDFSRFQCGTSWTKICEKGMEDKL